MLGRHRHRIALIAHDVTAGACGRRGFEDSFDVTGLAAHPLVRTQQWKCGGRMVKAATALRLCLRQVQHHAQTEQHERRCADFAMQRMEHFRIEHSGHLNKV